MKVACRIRVKCISTRWLHTGGVPRWVSFVSGQEYVIIYKDEQKGEAIMINELGMEHIAPRDWFRRHFRVVDTGSLEH